MLKRGEKEKNQKCLTNSLLKFHLEPNLNTASACVVHCPPLKPLILPPSGASLSEKKTPIPSPSDLENVHIRNTQPPRPQTILLTWLLFFLSYLSRSLSISQLKMSCSFKLIELSMLCFITVFKWPLVIALPPFGPPPPVRFMSVSSPSYLFPLLTPL